MLNLRIMQNACNQLKLHLPIDPLRLSKQRLNDNWNLIIALHRHLAPDHTPPEEHPPGFKARRPLEPLTEQQYFGGGRSSYVPEGYKPSFNGGKYSVGKIYR